jgi:hypothetical protein
MFSESLFILILSIREIRKTSHLIHQDVSIYDPWLIVDLVKLDILRVIIS